MKHISPIFLALFVAGCIIDERPANTAPQPAGSGSAAPSASASTAPSASATTPAPAEPPPVLKAAPAPK